MQADTGSEQVCIIQQISKVEKETRVVEMATDCGIEDALHQVSVVFSLQAYQPTT